MDLGLGDVQLLLVDFQLCFERSDLFCLGGNLRLAFGGSLLPGNLLVHDGPFIPSGGGTGIRTQDLTIMSRVLHLTELYPREMTNLKY